MFFSLSTYTLNSEVLCAGEPILNSVKIHSDTFVLVLWSWKFTCQITNVK